MRLIELIKKKRKEKRNCLAKKKMGKHIFPKKKISTKKFLLKT